MSRSPESETREGSPAGYLAGWQATLELLRRGKSWSGHERNCAFLNVSAQGAPKFADVSAVTGLDFADDGRGLAAVDWDGDGDLDLWFANRTGPRLRLMLNRGARNNSFLALRLRGTASNRDAIGARVEVVLRDPSGGRFIQTLHAGDGFLSQSSKWLHFGLGPDPDIERVTVRWPSRRGSTREVFSGIESGGRYLLVEGGGEALPATMRPVVTLEPAAQESPPPAAAERAFLPVRVPTPRLRYARLENPEEPVLEVEPAGPLLVNFWATWCLPCIAELKELTTLERKIEAAGLAVLALSVDGLAQDQTTRPADAARLLESLGFPHPSGMASVDLLDKVELIDEILFDRSRPFAVPASYLLDRHGRLAAIYRGRLDLEALLHDVARLDASPQSLHAASVPLAGRWIARLPDLDPSSLARPFRDRHPEDAERYLQLALEQTSVDAGAEQAALHLALAESIVQQGRLGEAAGHLEQAVELDPNLGRAHFVLAGLRRAAGRRGEAITHYSRAVEIDPEDAEAHHGLGVTLRTAGQLDEAFRHLAAAARLRPEWPAPLIPMVWMLVATEPDEAGAREAVRLAERAVELTGGGNPVALDTLAAAFAAAGRLEEAAATARRAVERARAQGNEALAAGIAERLRGYRDGGSG